MADKVVGPRMLLAAFTAASLLLECACYSMVAVKPYQQVQPNITFTIMCQADEPLGGCQFKALSNNKVIEMGGGKSSPFYSGTGLEDGQCGYANKLPTSNQYFPFGCRARAHDGSWQYATAVIDGFDVSMRILPVGPGPRFMLVDPGSNVTLTFTTGVPLFSCTFQWPGHRKWTSSGTNSTYTIDNSNLKAGICRLTLHTVKSIMSGFVVSDIRSDVINGLGGEFIQLTTLIVKTAPSAPVLTLDNADGVFNEGDFLRALCYVGPARPMASISWLLGGAGIQGQAEDYSEMPWEDEAASVRSKLSRKLSKEDDGKELVCRIHHVTFPGGKTEIRKKISVRVAPSAPVITLSKADGVFDEGDIMEASCNVSPAQPPAQITWLLDDHVIPNVTVTSPVSELKRTLSREENRKDLVCRVNHIALPGRTKETRKKISVRVAPSAPVITLSKADGVFDEGDIMEASCNVGFAQPPAQITWMLDDYVIPNVTDLSPKSKLKRRLSREDNGKELICRLNHVALPGGLDKTRKKISVRVAPSTPVITLSKTDGVFDEGDIMEASCNFDFAQPPAQITWMLDDYVILSMVDTNKFKWKLSREDDGKELVCQVNHIALPGKMEETRKNVSVRVAPSAPVITLSKADGVFDEGDIMEASCDVGFAQPPAQITWMLDDYVIQNFTDTSSVSELKHKLSREDDGKELVCRVQHVTLLGGVKQTRKKFLVRVAPSTPVITLSKTDGVFDEGDIMEASCDVGFAQPPAQITWLLDDYVIPNVTDTSPVSKLKRKLSREDDGKDLVCRVNHIALPEKKRLTGMKISVKGLPVLSFLQRNNGFLVGASGSVLCFAVVVAALLLYIRIARKWCFVRGGNNVDRQANIYDDVMDLTIAPNLSNNVDRQSAIYDDVMDFSIAPNLKQDSERDSTTYETMAFVPTESCGGELPFEH